MRDRERKDTLAGTVRAMCRDTRSDETREFMKMLGKEAYMRFVFIPLALVRHPVAMIRAGLLIGSRESQEKDWETLRKMPQPSFIRGREKSEQVTNSQ